MRSTAAITFVIALLAKAGVFASPVEILTPGLIKMDQDTGNLSIEGRVEVNQHPYTLYADAIQWDQTRQQIHAVGDVQLWLQPDHGIALPQLPERLTPRSGVTTAGNNPQELLRAQALNYDLANQVLSPEGVAAIYLGVARLLAEDLRFELESRAFTTGKYRVGLQTLYLEGKSLESDGEGMLTHNARFFLGEPERMGVSGRARKIEKLGEDTVRFHGAVFKVGAIPLLYLPRYTHSFSRSRFSIDGSIGFTAGIGAYTEIRPIYMPYERTRLFWDFNLYSQRGVLTGPGFDITYLHGTDGFLKAKLESGYIRDQGELGLDSLGMEIPKNRHTIDTAIVYRRKREFQVLATIQHWSDTEILRDFSNSRFQNIQQPENFFETNWLSGNWAATVQTRFHLEPFEYAVERLPEIRIERLPAFIAGTRLVYATRFSWSKLRSVTPLESIVLDHERSEWDATLYYPVDVNRWLDWVPQAGFKALQYQQNHNNGESFHRVISEVGFNLDAHMFGEWKVKNRIWNIHGMRHLLRPTLQVRRFAASGEVPAGFFPIERDRFRTGMDDLDLNASPFTDELENATRLRIGVANTLIAKPFKGRTRRLARWICSGTAHGLIEMTGSEARASSPNWTSPLPLGCASIYSHGSTLGMGRWGISLVGCD
jgi:LPS-assembly protein